METMKKIEILIPCYNEEQNIQPLYCALYDVINQYDNQYLWTIVFVNDGSTDQTLERIKALHQQDQRVKYISLSRNFGKENAMMAGFDHFNADCMVIIDADLQHPPYVIKEMISWWEQGYKDVYAKRSQRGKERLLRKCLTLSYYYILKKIAHTEVLTDVGDFRLLDKRCVEALQELRETQRYTKGLYSWIGFHKKEITFEQESRKNGRSSFNLRRLLNLAIEGITSYTTAPLRISTIVGFIISMIAFVYMVYVLVKTTFYGDPVQGYPTLIIVILFLGGFQLLSIGIIGEYLSRIFYETKRRPIYFIEECEIEEKSDLHQQSPFIVN